MTPAMILSPASMRPLSCSRTIAAAFEAPSNPACESSRRRVDPVGARSVTAQLFERAPNVCEVALGTGSGEVFQQTEHLGQVLVSDFGFLCALEEAFESAAPLLFGGRVRSVQH